MRRRDPVYLSDGRDDDKMTVCPPPPPSPLAAAAAAAAELGRRGVPRPRQGQPNAAAVAALSDH